MPVDVVAPKTIISAVGATQAATEYLPTETPKSTMETK